MKRNSMKLKEQSSFNVSAYIEEIKNGDANHDGEFDRPSEIMEADKFLTIADAAEIIKQGYELNSKHMHVLVDKVYPKKEKPTLKSLMESVLKPVDDSHTFDQGSWVEMLGDDMQWHLAKIRRVVRQPPDTWDFDDPKNDGVEPPWIYFYNVANVELLEETRLRAPEVGLKGVFGARPWLWQQYALLKIERNLRFQKDNERDFEEVDCQQYANEKFESWLNDPRNSDFKEHYEQQPKYTQQLLVDHLLKPFELLDELVEDKERWNFDEHDFSVYSYTSVLGSGLIVFLLIWIIQIVVPLILLYSSLKAVDERYNVDDLDDLWTKTQTWNDFCSVSGNGDYQTTFEGKLLNLAVIGIYATKVVPDTFMGIINTAGSFDSTYSRVNSMRKIIWDQGDDSFLQQLGYKVELYMNTAYVCLLYAMMLFILFNTDEVLDIVLNALAIEFIHEIDEEVADAIWYDKGNRWLRAGALEMTLRASIRLHHLQSTTQLCKEYNIDPEALIDACGSNSLKGKSLALKDDASHKYRNEEDSVWLYCAQWARKDNNYEALKQFQKPVVQFGTLFRISYQLGLTNTGMFNRFVEYRTWSRWEKVLFLPRVPDAESVLQRKASLHVDADGSLKIDNFYDQYTAIKNSFFGNAAIVLSGFSMAQSLRGMYSRGRYAILLFRFVDGVIEWLFIWAQILFPVYIVLMVGIVLQCYT